MAKKSKTSDVDLNRLMGHYLRKEALATTTGGAIVEDIEVLRQRLLERVSDLPEDRYAPKFGPLGM